MQAEFEQVGPQQVLLRVENGVVFPPVLELQVPLQEFEGAHVSQLEPDALDDVAFHLEDLLLGVGFVANVNVVLQFRWVDFLIGKGEEGCYFVFGRDKKRSDADKLEQVFRAFVLGKVPVDEIDGEVECFW